MYSQSYKRYVTLLLLVIYIFNQVDRGIFGILMEPISKDLGLSDTQLGFLAGPALALFYAALGVPIARLADRRSRVSIMTVAIAVWSSVVIVSATVSQFWHLSLVRVGVGIGEAGFSAIAMSVITDFHPESAPQRTRALSIFMLAIPLGVVVSSLMGGWINVWLGWRAAFIVAGVPGLLLAVLMKLTVQEPARCAGSQAIATAGHRPSLSSVFAMIWRRNVLRHLAIAQGAANAVAGCMAIWIPAFLIRQHGISTGELGTWLAAIFGVGGSAGIWLGGYLTARYAQHDENLKLRMVAIATALIVPVSLYALWTPSKVLALVLLLPAFALMFFFYAPMTSLVQGLTQSGIRATTMAVFILIQIVGSGMLGIQLSGLLSDILARELGSSVSGLRWSMTIISLLALWAAAHFWAAGRSVRRDDATDGCWLRPER